MKIPQSSNMSRQDWEDAIDQWIFDEQHRKMLKRNLLDGVKYEDLAEEFGFTKEWVSRLLPKLQKKLFKNV